MHLRSGIERIGKEHQIEFGAFRGLRDPLDQVDVFRPGLGPYNSPARDVMSGPENEETQMHF
jgi:hypothetical protein